MSAVPARLLRWRKLNLGCGRDRRPGYLNVDMHASQGPDLVADVRDLKELPSLYYKEIVAQDILEHFKRIETRQALYEWNRLLIPGGGLFLRTTYLNGLLHLLDEPRFQSIEGQELLILSLFSTQACEGDYHLTAFSEPLFRFYLWECGFNITDLRLNGGWLFECTARKARDYSFEDLIQRSPDDDTFLARAYEAILFRPPDQHGLPHFRRELQEGRMTRREVTRYFLQSEERKQQMIAKAPAFPRAFGEQRAA